MYGRSRGLAPRVPIDLTKPSYKADGLPDQRPAMTLLSRAPHPHIKCALAAMTDMGLFEADHQRAKLRQAQPFRHLASQHPALGVRSNAAALSGDDQHKAKAITTRALKKR